MQNETEMIQLDIKSMLPEEIASHFSKEGIPQYRAKQVFAWMSRGVSGFDEMTDLSKQLRETMEEQFFFHAPKLLKKQKSKEDGTEKYLWELSDGNAVETVVMQYKHGNTVCISCQVGCRMGCAFCASTLGGLVRNLSAGEMLDQVIWSQKEFGDKISNIVLMGIGEPLDNFETVLRFLELVSHPQGLHIGMRHISLSTCGLAERIDKLGDHHLQLTLSVSLHAPDDATRSRIMPVNRKADVQTLMQACRRYYAKTNRRISFEYAMIADVNDTLEHAKQLADLLHGAQKQNALFAHVNLIPLNPVEERQFAPSSPSQVRAFQKALEDRGIHVTVRRRLGKDVDASCGQLRRKTQMKDERK